MSDEATQATTEQTSSEPQVPRIFDAAAEFDRQLAERAAAQAATATPQADGDDGDDESDVEQEASGKPQSRAQKRIKQLANEKNELKQQIEGFSSVSAQVQQMQAQFQQMQQMYQEQNQKLMEALTARNAPAPVPDLPPDDPIDRVKWEAVREARGEFSSELEKLKAEREAEKAEREQRKRQLQEHREKQAFHNQMMEETSVALGDAFSDLDAEDVSTLNELGANENLLLAANVYGASPSKVVSQWKQFLDAYADARDKARAKANKAVVDTGRNVPAPIGASRSVTGQDAYRLQRQSEPTMNDIRKMGFPDKMAWRKAQGYR